MDPYRIPAQYGDKTQRRIIEQSEREALAQLDIRHGEHLNRNERDRWAIAESLRWSPANGRR